MKLDINQIKNILNEKIDVIIYDEIDSTNSICKKLGDLNQLNKLVISNCQTNGRGRLGRTFISNKGKGIYMSILLKPNIQMFDISKITCVVSTSIAKVLENIIKRKISIKWVNDLYLNHKKFCGILTESKIVDNQIKYIVIGIGINLFHQNFPTTINATSIEDETDIIIDINEVIGKIVNQIFEDIKNINSQIIDYYKERLYLKNQIVELNVANQVFLGKIIDINDNFELLVNVEGIIKTINSGEIIKLKIKEEK